MFKFVSHGWTGARVHLSLATICFIECKYRLHVGSVFMQVKKRQKLCVFSVFKIYCHVMWEESAHISCVWLYTCVSLSVPVCVSACGGRVWLFLAGRSCWWRREVVKGMSEWGPLNLYKCSKCYLSPGNRTFCKKSSNSWKNCKKVKLKTDLEMKQQQLWICSIFADSIYTESS